MGRFLALLLLFVVAAGSLLHREVDLPTYGSWVGQLPGDLILKKGKTTIFLPFTSAFLASGAVSLFLSLFRRKGN
ncbi:MAG: DUF2905 domain-containing protein [Verrucomicrobia bacterium]|nr:DUF2905 domain-containing protein [Verrucomicrobiota bacterium]